uniref:Uncharacterized protein n=1 Tax=Parascaris equorum TaxID=6256 RepID=A0A914RQS0_PAREQ
MAGKRFPESELDRLMEEMMQDVLNYGDRREQHLIELMEHVRNQCKGIDVERLKMPVFEAIARSVPASNMFILLNQLLYTFTCTRAALQMHLEKIRETGPMFSKPLQRSELLALSLQGYD